MGSAESTPTVEPAPVDIQPPPKELPKQVGGNEATLFVFYKAKPESTWKYGRLPKGWWWVGAGSTSPVGASELKEYPREEQFAGPKENQKAMRDYLDQYFYRLKEKGAIIKYKIRNSYLP